MVSCLLHTPHILPQLKLLLSLGTPYAVLWECCRILVPCILLSLIPTSLPLPWLPAILCPAHLHLPGHDLQLPPMPPSTQHHLPSLPHQPHAPPSLASPHLFSTLLPSPGANCLLIPSIHCSQQPPGSAPGWGQANPAPAPCSLSQIHPCSSAALKRRRAVGVPLGHVMFSPRGHTLCFLPTCSTPTCWDLAPSRTR